MFKGHVILLIVNFVLGSQMVYAKTPSKLPLRIVEPKAFCSKVQNIVTTLGEQQGLDRRESMRFGGKATSIILTQLSSGKMNPYLDVNNLDGSGSTTPVRQHQWVSIPEVLVSSMGIVPTTVLFIDQVNDLRFTPQMAPGSQLLVLASDLGDLTPERARMVAQSAQALGVSVSVIWVGKSRTAKDGRNAQGLALISSLTDGAFLDLSHQNACRGV